MVVTLELLPYMILLSGSLDQLCCLLLPHGRYFIRQFLVLALFVGFCFGEIMCIWDSYVYEKVFFVFLFIKVMSGRLQGTVLSVSMLQFQYSLKFSFSSTLAGVYLQYGLLSSINSAASASF